MMRVNNAYAPPNLLTILLLRIHLIFRREVLRTRLQPARAQAGCRGLFCSSNHHGRELCRRCESCSMARESLARPREAQKQCSLCVLGVDNIHNQATQSSLQRNKCKESKGLRKLLTTTCDSPSIGTRSCCPLSTK